MTRPSSQASSVPRWTSQEDKILLDHVKEHGTRHWKLLLDSGKLPKWDNKACCNRYRILKSRVNSPLTCTSPKEAQPQQTSDAGAALVEPSTEQEAAAVPAELEDNAGAADADSARADAASIAAGARARGDVDAAMDAVPADASIAGGAGGADAGGACAVPTSVADATPAHAAAQAPPADTSPCGRSDCTLDNGGRCMEGVHGGMEVLVDAKGSGSKAEEQGNEKGGTMNTEGTSKGKRGGKCEPVEEGDNFEGKPTKKLKKVNGLPGWHAGGDGERAHDSVGPQLAAYNSRVQLVDTPQGAPMPAETFQGLQDFSVGQVVGSHGAKVASEVGHALAVKSMSDKFLLLQPSPSAHLRETNAPALPFKSITGLLPMVHEAAWTPQAPVHEVPLPVLNGSALCPSNRAHEGLLEELRALSGMEARINAYSHASAAPGQLTFEELHKNPSEVFRNRAPSCSFRVHGGSISSSALSAPREAGAEALHPDAGLQLQRKAGFGWGQGNQGSPSCCQSSAEGSTTRTDLREERAPWQPMGEGRTGMRSARDAQNDHLRKFLERRWCSVRELGPHSSSALSEVSPGSSAPVQATSVLPEPKTEIRVGQVSREQAQEPRVPSRKAARSYSDLIKAQNEAFQKNAGHSRSLGSPYLEELEMIVKSALDSTTAAHSHKVH